MLRALREERGLSIQELAQYAGVDRVYIYRLEKGEKEAPSEDVMAKLIKVLKPDERQARMFRYLAEYPKTDPALVMYVLQDRAITNEVFEVASATAFRGTAATEPASLISRIQRVLLEEGGDG